MSFDCDARVNESIPHLNESDNEEIVGTPKLSVFCLELIYVGLS